MECWNVCIVNMLSAAEIAETPVMYNQSLEVYNSLVIFKRLKKISRLPWSNWFGRGSFSRLDSQPVTSTSRFGSGSIHFFFLFSSEHVSYLNYVLCISLFILYLTDQIELQSKLYLLYTYVFVKIGSAVKFQEYYYNYLILTTVLFLSILTWYVTRWNLVNNYSF